MLDNEMNKNEVQVAVRPMMPGSMMGVSAGISSLPLDGSSTMSAMPDCPKGGIIVKVRLMAIRCIQSLIDLTYLDIHLT